MVEGIWQDSVLEDEMYMRLKQETGKYLIQPIDCQHVLSKFKSVSELRAIQLLNTKVNQALSAGYQTLLRLDSA